jgi:type I restriction enzyme M protein
VNQQEISRISGFIWGIADDVLRDIFVRGHYRDVILPMIVLRRLDLVLESSKENVLKTQESLIKAKVVNQEQPLRKASGQAFYNTSKFTFRELRNSANKSQLRANFDSYLDGFSSNVQEIIDNFTLRNQIDKLSKADALGPLIEKFLDPKLDIAGLDNHAMGSVFEELVRKFNEENNEEAGEHWTPRDAVRLMSNLVFRPIQSQITSGTYLLYDAAIGTGGMLTVAERTLAELAAKTGKEVSTHLYGQEINGETYAICKADLLLSGEGLEADNVKGGPDMSTLSNDAFRSMKFDFMLSNPPYGKSWKTDLERMGGKKGVNDPRFVINYAGDPEYSLLTRTSDGQMLFLANMISKMKHDTPLGSRIAEVHSGSSLFTGDAGQGESNVRRWIIESDWLEAIIQLPPNMFYNTGIATYIWVLSNRKPEHRRGKVQLVDASAWSTPLLKNLGAKNCELSEENIDQILSSYIDFKETEESKIFSNEDFGYRKVKIERPLRLRSRFTNESIENLRFNSGDYSLRKELYFNFGDALYTEFDKIKEQISEYLDPSDLEESDESDITIEVDSKTKKRLLDGKKWSRDLLLYQTGIKLSDNLGTEQFDDYNIFVDKVKTALKDLNIRIGASDLKALLKAVSWRDETAPLVVKKHSAANKIKADPLFGRYLFVNPDGQSEIIEYESDGDLSDFEQIPINEPGGVAAFIEREVWPYTPDAWVDEKSEKIGYEISFNRHFYKPVMLRSLKSIASDLESAAEASIRLMKEFLGDGK